MSDAMTKSTRKVRKSKNPKDSKELENKENSSARQNNSKPVKCPHCPRTFQYESHLKFHSVIHEPGREKEKGKASAKKRSGGSKKTKSKKPKAENRESERDTDESQRIQSTSERVRPEASGSAVLIGTTAGPPREAPSARRNADAALPANLEPPSARAEGAEEPASAVHPDASRAEFPAGKSSDLFEVTSAEPSDGTQLDTEEELLSQLQSPDRIQLNPEDLTFLSEIFDQAQPVDLYDSQRHPANPLVPDALAAGQPQPSDVSQPHPANALPLDAIWSQPSDVAQLHPENAVAPAASWNQTQPSDATRLHPESALHLDAIWSQERPSDVNPLHRAGTLAAADVWNQAQPSGVAQLHQESSALASGAILNQPGSSRLHPEPLSPGGAILNPSQPSDNIQPQPEALPAHGATLNHSQSSSNVQPSREQPQPSCSMQQQQQPGNPLTPDIATAGQPLPSETGEPPFPAEASPADGGSMPAADPEAADGNPDLCQCTDCVSNGPPRSYVSPEMPLTPANLFPPVENSTELPTGGDGPVYVPDFVPIEYLVAQVELQQAAAGPPSPRRGLAYNAVVALDGKDDGPAPSSDSESNGSETFASKVSKEDEENNNYDEVSVRAT